DQGIANLAGRMEGDVAIVPAGRILRRWADLQPDDAPAFPDGGHPSFAASLVIAATLYESVVGKAPVAAEMLIDFPLLVPRVPISAGEPREAQHDLGVPARPIRLVAGAVAPYLEAASALR